MRDVLLVLSSSCLIFASNGRRVQVLQSWLSGYKQGAAASHVHQGAGPHTVCARRYSRLRRLTTAQLTLAKELARPGLCSLNGEPEANVEVRDAGVKGKGAFAAAPLKAGSFVSTYVGKLVTAREVDEMYNNTNCDYLFALTSEDDPASQLCLDAENSTHFSRYYNHAEHGTLDVIVDSARQRIDFFASRDVEIGEELTFDYGVAYWLCKTDPPSPDSDSRNFSADVYHQRPPELSVLYPPPVGTLFPLTPMKPSELQAALALPERESTAALLRCLEFFGARRMEDGSIEVSFGVGEDAERQLLIEPDHATLQRAATACLAEAVLDVADPSGAASSKFYGWVKRWDPVLKQIRQLRSESLRLASIKHDVARLATHLLWQLPSQFGAVQPLTRQEYESIMSQIGEEARVGIEPSHIFEMLTQRAPGPRMTGFITMLHRWYELGDGCTVASIWPPKLEGAVPEHLSRVWDRVPELIELSIFTTEYRRLRLDEEDDNFCWSPLWR